MTFDLGNKMIVRKNIKQPPTVLYDKRGASLIM